jgi:hypothetical protein
LHPHFICSICEYVHICLSLEQIDMCILCVLCMHIIGIDSLALIFTLAAGIIILHFPLSVYVMFDYTRFLSLIVLCVVCGSFIN